MRLKVKISYLSLGIAALVSIAITVAAVWTIDQLLDALNETNLRAEMARIKGEFGRMQLSMRLGDVDDKGIHTPTAQRVLGEFFQSYQPQTGMLLIRTDSGQVIYPPDFIFQIGKYPTLDLSDGGQGMRRMYYNGEPYLFVYDSFKPWKWQLILSANEEPLSKSRDRFLSTVILILFGGLLVGGFLSFAIARSIANPLSRLAMATRHFDPGKTGGMLPRIGTTDEVQDLTQAFNKMAGRLKCAYHAIEAQTKDLKHANDHLILEVSQRKLAQQELATLNKELEMLVASRTWDLQQKAAELEEANAKLLRQDALKSTFLSSISHEFRTPLTSIIGFVKLIQRDYQRIFRNTDAMVADSSDKVVRIRDNLDVIQGESERLCRLINDFLDFAKIEAGRLQWHDQPVDLAECLLQSINAVEGVFGDKQHVVLELHLPETLPECIIDPDRFKQLIINLISNAFKNTDSGFVRISGCSRDDTVQVCVADSGSGVPRSELVAVFDKFHQVQFQDTLLPKPKGTGLGLSICRQIIEHYNGLIWMESESDKGCSVYLELSLHS